MNGSIETTWQNIKEFVDDRSLSIQWLDVDENYYLYALDGFFSLYCVLPKSDPASEEQTDFEDNYKVNGNQSPKATVTTQYEVNDKDLKLAKAVAIVDETATATASIKIPGTFGSSDGRYIAGGYGFSEDYNKDDYALCWVSDDDRNIAWMIALAMNPSASEPISDGTIQAMGVIPGFGIEMPEYPIVKTFHDEDVDDSNKGWYFWPTAVGNSEPAIGEVEIEPIAGYGFLPAGLYLKVKYVRPAEVTNGSIRLDFFWGKKE